MVNVDPNSEAATNAWKCFDLLTEFLINDSLGL
jgi:hypothetical protein